MTKMKKPLLILLLFLFTASLSFGASVDVFKSTLYKDGTVGNDVKLLQQALKIAGTFNEVKLTDNFGEITKNAVIEFQINNGLEADGIAGKSTLGKIVELGYIPELSENIYKVGMEHKDIIIIQAALHSSGHFDNTEFTTLFDEKTKDSVISFQNEYNLDADGIVGNQTISKFIELGYITKEEIPTALNVSSLSTDPTVSRGSVKRFGEYISWSDARSLLPVGTKVKIQDFYTGKTFDMYVGYGTLHADVEPLTSKDTQIMLDIWGGDFTWARRPVLVYYNDRVLAASLNCMPHAGREDKPALEYVSGRSSGFGSGKNYDLVKGNGASGVMCLHFQGSKIHATNKVDPEHQVNVRIAAGL